MRKIRKFATYVFVLTCLNQCLWFFNLKIVKISSREIRQIRHFAKYKSRKMSKNGHSWKLNPAKLFRLKCIPLTLFRAGYFAGVGGSRSRGRPPWEKCLIEIKNVMKFGRYIEQLILTTTAQKASSPVRTISQRLTLFRCEITKNRKIAIILCHVLQSPRVSHSELIYDTTQ